MDAATLASLAGFICDRTAAATADVRESTSARCAERAWRARDAGTEVITIRERAPERAEQLARGAWRGTASWVSAARRALGTTCDDADGLAASISRHAIERDGAEDDELGKLRMVRRSSCTLQLTDTRTHVRILVKNR